MKKITLELQKNECVGDSVAKHNYNALVIDAKVCNLSSIFFNTNDNYKNYFDDYIQNIPTLTAAYTNYNNQSVYRYKLADATVKTMSPYWNKHEFTVQLNTNISLEFSTTRTGNYLKSDFIPLCAACYDYLNTNYPASAFMQPTTAHVVGFYFSSIQPILSSHVLVDTTPIEFSESTNQKLMNVYFTKPSINLSGMYICSFTNSIIKNFWLLTKVTPSLTKDSFEPISLPIPNKPTILFTNSTLPPRPCCGVSVGWSGNCCDATISIEYTNPKFDNRTTSINIFYSKDKQSLGTLHSTLFSDFGNVTIGKLEGNTTYYITAINNFNNKSQTLTVTTPVYI